MGEVQVQEMDLVQDIALQLPSPEIDVVASYHFGTLTPRIKSTACFPLAFPLQRAATVDTKGFESGLTAQSHEH